MPRARAREQGWAGEAEGACAVAAAAAASANCAVKACQCGARGGRCHGARAAAGWLLLGSSPNWVPAAGCRDPALAPAASTQWSSLMRCARTGGGWGRRNVDEPAGGAQQRRARAAAPSCNTQRARYRLRADAIFMQNFRRSFRPAESVMHPPCTVVALACDLGQVLGAYMRYKIVSMDPNRCYIHVKLLTLARTSPAHLSRIFHPLFLSSHALTHTSLLPIPKLIALRGR